MVHQTSFQEFLLPPAGDSLDSNVFPSCAITRAASQRKEVESRPENLELPDKVQIEPLSRDVEQMSDKSLADLFDKVVTVDTVRDAVLFHS